MHVPVHMPAALTTGSFPLSAMPFQYYNWASPASPFGSEATGHFSQGAIEQRVGARLVALSYTRPSFLLTCLPRSLHTAAVWASTSKLGCGVATCSDGMTLVVW